MFEFALWQVWLIFAGIFFIAEILTVGFLIFWLGVGAILAMIVSFFTSNILIQMTVFVVSSTVLIFATKPLTAKFTKKDKAITNVYTLVGKKAKVIVEINTTEGKGQIKVNGETWSATYDGDEIIPVGSEVEIKKIEGVKAYISPIKIAETK